MIRLQSTPAVLVDGKLLESNEAAQRGIVLEDAKKNTLAYRILQKHTTPNAHDNLLHIKFDALVSHDITYVGILQTARASGLNKVPLPYALTNCHNSLCAVGGTINEDDHLFGLTAAQKYGCDFVPPNLAVIHQYAREMLAGCERMILGSDSHTRYGALGCMAIGEGGPELVKQILSRTYDIAQPDVVLIWLENAPKPGVGPQDVALAIIKAVFKNGFVKNKVMEFAGPGIKNLSVEYRCGIDVMTTETTCLSSIWTTDHKVEEYLACHGRADAYKELGYTGPAAFSSVVYVDLASIEPMIALPFHPSNVYTIAEVIQNADDILASIEAEAQKQFGDIATHFSLRSGIKDDGVHVGQGIIAGCAGGSFENLTLAAAILDGKYTGNSPFALSVYPASEPQALALVKNGSYAKLMQAGAIIKTAFCGPCFGAGDTPANGTLSIRHTTRNFPNREGSKPSAGQLAGVALMDARSIAATAAHGGVLTPATDLDWDKLNVDLHYSFDPMIYKTRCYYGYNKADSAAPLHYGPNITDWPKMSNLPDTLVLFLASVINDPVTTTDELIPSGETSSLRSNPLKLAEYALSKRDPEYVGYAKSIQCLEKQRLAGAELAPLQAKLQEAIAPLAKVDAPLWQEMFAQDSLSNIGIGTTIFAVKPGDGSAREQAASCQKVLGGWANLAIEYATKRYRSNLINWGMLPFLMQEKDATALSKGQVLVVPHIKQAIENNAEQVQAWLVSNDQAVSLELRLGALTEDERKIILTGCLINYYNAGL